MKVGDYVRNKDGISKIISNPNTNKFNIDIFKKDGITLRCIKQKDVIKSSPNIIDILEVGDYVNGYLVIEKDINNELRYIDLKDRNMKYVKYLDIKSIVTKEMFKNMEYEVK